MQAVAERLDYQDERINMRVSGKLLADLKDMAHMRGMTLTQYMLDISRHDIEENKDNLELYRELKRPT